MDEYYSDKPFSYGGKYRLYEYFSKKKVNDMISKSDIYTHFKQHRKPIYVYSRHELFQSDVVFFTNKDMVEVNNGFKYLFTTIDVFTKMVSVYPPKANTCKNVLECFKDFLISAVINLNV